MFKTICIIAVFLFSQQAFPTELKHKVKFTYKPQPTEQISSIAIAGTFNNWNKDKDLLKKQSDGKYSIVLELPEGLYHYKFVINGNKWIEDPQADPALKRPDGFGGFNSGIFVGESSKKYGSALPNEIALIAVKHDKDSIEYLNVISKDLIEVKLRVLQDDLSAVNLYIDKLGKVQLKKTLTSFGFDYYKGFFDPKGMQTIKYFFELIDGTAKLNYPKDEKFTAELKPKFYTPNWAKNTIWYEIMLDRFCNGDVSNDPLGTLPWTFDFAPNKKHPSERGKFYEVVWGRNFGGDLQGLMKKLTYLKELGITGIYLTPVFEAESYHKYNTADYRHIDDNFGVKYSTEEPKKLATETEDPETWIFTETDKLFLEFLQQAHAIGFKVIIDGVFNHSGEDFFAFKDLKQKAEESKYKDWYVVTDWEVFKRSAHLGKGYVGWASFGGLPEYAEDDSGLVTGIKEHIFNITRRWMDPNGDGDPSDGIDGWRLDVPDCIKQPFWIDWCKLVRSINPEAYIVGELWQEASAWLRPELFHAQMNYPLAKLILKFIVDEALKPSQFDSALHELLNLYPMQVNFVQLNLIDSHDTDRLVSMIYNPHRSYDKKNRLNPQDGDYNPNYKPGKPSKDSYELMKLVTCLQFSFVGSPMIWYGDEVGMWGADDPFNRLPMIWEELQPYENTATVVNEDILTYYKKLIAIRNTYSALQTGLFETILTDDTNNIYAFSRRKDSEIVIVLVNNSNKFHKLELALEDINDMELCDVLNEQNYKVSNGKIAIFNPERVYSIKNNLIKLTLKPKFAAILVSHETTH